ncbi:uncharacterized protein LOC127095863 [Lathyrus oleraceus]|uniref:uncharacterized protein LOC127095863 n=1 Tax=Pisum sativum TaxID=3888 RepID=UPI0021D22FB5|nr:uncharacterized protein LOC127095863 [Pisum sativum]
MSQHFSPTHMHVLAETSGSSSRSSRENAPYQMSNLEDLILDVALVSKVCPPPQKKATPSVSKVIKTSSKSSELIIPSKDKNTAEEESRHKGYGLRNPSMHADDPINLTASERSEIDKELRKFVASVLKEVNSDVLPDVQTSLAKDPSPDNDSREKAEENVPDHVARERRSKKKVELVVNVEELTSDEEPLINIVSPSIAKRLQRRKGKTLAFEDSPSREVKRKADGLLKGTPSKSSTGKYPVGPTRSWSEVVTPTRKTKVVSSSESEFDVAHDVQDITPIKRFANKKPHDARSKAPLDNASLHYVKNAERWKYVIQRRVAL